MKRKPTIGNARAAGGTTCIDMKNDLERAFVEKHGIATQPNAMCPHHAHLDEAQWQELQHIRYGI
jgi:hypothetical protein